MKRIRKLSDEAFFSVLRSNGGIYARTARAIQDQFGIEFSRQAVRERALTHPDLLEDINEEFIDLAESSLHTLLRSDNETIRLKTAMFVLKTRGQERGYVERKVDPESSSGPSSAVRPEDLLIEWLEKCRGLGMTSEEILEDAGQIPEFHQEIRERLRRILIDPRTQI